jgi:hypothetical protein
VAYGLVARRPDAGAAPPVMVAGREPFMRAIPAAGKHIAAILAELDLPC